MLPSRPTKATRRPANQCRAEVSCCALSKGLVIAWVIVGALGGCLLKIKETTDTTATD
jgi:hypothetical protein